MINLSLNELKLIAKTRHIKDYQEKSEEELIKILKKKKTFLKIKLKKSKKVLVN